MGRHKKQRLIRMAPHFRGFRPEGIQCKSKSAVGISFEEYEALSLCDYELLTQSESARLMQISRPTFTRIYESVRRKVAKAFIEGSCITFVKGDSEYSEWYRCEKCNISFSITADKQKTCPLCKSNLVTNIM